MQSVTISERPKNRFAVHLDTAWEWARRTRFKGTNYLNTVIFDNSKKEGVLRDIFKDYDTIIEIHGTERVEI
jgi:hypothetical protein